MVKLYDDPEKLAAMRAEAERNIRARTLEGYRRAADIDKAAEALKSEFDGLTTKELDDLYYYRAASVVIYAAYGFYDDAAFQEKP